IPAGFAHGFVALEDNTQFLYKTTNYYNKESEGAIVWNDPSIAIDWPLSNINQVLVSDKDKVASKLEDAKLFK
ncbi:dTDP-4-dehydrorhamnose 3,5-epimerase family protein, partial [Acinetobacter baumannii]